MIIKSSASPADRLITVVVRAGSKTPPKYCSCGTPSIVLFGISKVSDSPGIIDGLSTTGASAASTVFAVARLTIAIRIMFVIFLIIWI